MLVNGAPAAGGLPPIECVVADDHEMLQQGLAQLLDAEADIRVTGRASTLAQARHLTESRKPHVLVVDMQMPDGSGIDLCEALRDSATKVLVYSGHDEPDLVEAALEAGALGYVLKSGPPQTIVQAVRLVNGGGCYIDAVLAPNLLRRSQERREVLSFREREVLQLLSQGRTTSEAALHLHLSPSTVRSYAENAMSKLGVGNRTHAVAQALRRDLIS